MKHLEVIDRTQTPFLYTSSIKQQSSNVPCDVDLQASSMLLVWNNVKFIICFKSLQNLTRHNKGIARARNC